METPTRADAGEHAGERAASDDASRDFLEHAPAGLIEARDDGTISYANASLRDMLSLASPLEGTPIDAILTKASQVFYQTHFFPLLKLNGRADEIYMTLRASTGEPVHVLANGVRVASADGARIRCVFLPIRERQRYEAELLLAKKEAEAANAAKTRFLSTMSHDLRTPLGAIGGYVDLLMLGIHGELTDGQRQDLERIKGLSQSLLHMVEDILHIARADPQKLPVRMEAVSVSALLDEVETAILPQLSAAGLRYRREVARDLLAAHADSTRLQRILMNLIGNAVKFTPRGGEISVSARPVGAMVAIQVSDTGRGIPPDKIGRIFEPFMQVDTKDAALGGIGLGLAISREFARAMAGDIGVESVVGKGTVFTVTLNAAPEGSPAHSSPL